MKHLITSYTFSGKLSNLTENYDKVKQLELSENIVCVHHQTGHKCNFPKHKTDKKYSGFYNMVTIIMKYQSIIIRIKIFKSGSVIFHYSHATEISIDDIIEKLKEELSFDTKLTKYKLVMKVVAWKTNGNDLDQLKSYLEVNYKGNYDIVEHKSSLFPSISFTIHGNKVRLEGKSIICRYRRIEDKEIDNFMSILQKYFNNQNDEIEENNNQDNENVADEDEDEQLTIII